MEEKPSEQARDFVERLVRHAHLRPILRELEGDRVKIYQLSTEDIVRKTTDYDGYVQETTGMLLDLLDTFHYIGAHQKDLIQYNINSERFVIYGNSDNPYPSRASEAASNGGGR